MTIKKIAQAFHGIVRRELTEHLEEIDRLNGELLDTGVCATHDFCDANMLMADAFSLILGRDCDPASKDDAALWSKAWNVAYTVGFNKEWS